MMTSHLGNIQFLGETADSLRAAYDAELNANKPAYLAALRPGIDYQIVDERTLVVQRTSPEPNETKAPAPEPAPADAAPKPDSAMAGRFLRDVVGGPPVLTAIWIDPLTGEKGKIETKASFTGPDGQVDWAAVFHWIDARNGRANLYWSVNPLRAPKDSKASKVDIAVLRMLHVDVDLRVNEPQAEGIERIVGTFKSYTPPPDFIIRSGGGAQAFWKLDTPLELDGTKECADEAALFNKQLERDLDGDHCHDVSRIMRVPGTVNLPDKTKRAKGRKPALATYEVIQHG